MNAPPFPYFGGKTTLATRIAAVLPPHGHYVEPFAGSLAVLLAKQHAPMETVNDLDGEVVTFWRVLREQPADLARVCALTPHARAEHQDAYDRHDDLTDLERARRVWVCLTQGRGATLRTTGWRHYVAPAGGFGMPGYLDGYVDRMAAASERLHQVSLECRPALELIARYGTSPDVLLYVDPPYLGTSRANQHDRARSRHTSARYRIDMLDDEPHRELGQALLDCKAAVVLSGYPSPLYDEMFAGWDRIEFPTGTGQSARGEWSTRTEVLWSNRPIGQPSLFDEEVVAG